MARNPLSRWASIPVPARVLIRPDADEEDRTDILIRLLSIGIAQAVPSAMPEGDTGVDQSGSDSERQLPPDVSNPTLETLIESFRSIGGTPADPFGLNEIKNAIKYQDADDDEEFSTLAAGPNVNYFPRIDSAPYFYGHTQGRFHHLSAHH